MKVAVQGCSHGSLTAIYDSVAEYERQKGTKVDLLLLCGDFQALRSRHDFASLAVPAKFHALGTFHQYYSGERVAPVLTIVIGGNHEASNYMWELYHGGWLAPNIYYLGAAGSVLVDGLRIAGASGIFKKFDYHKGHFENVPFNPSTLRSIYHIRQYDVAKLMLLPRSHPTVFLSHDWPIGIARHGDTRALLKRKPFFRQEIEENTLGSPPLLDILHYLRPDYWFSAHLHVKFAAVFDHPEGDSGAAPLMTLTTPAAVIAAAAAVAGSAPAAGEAEVAINPDEINISDDEFDEPPAPAANPDEINIGDNDEDEGVVEAAVTVEAEAPTDEAAPPANPEEITLSDEDEFEEPPRAPPKSAETTPKPAVDAIINAPGAERTHFLALDKCGAGKEFIQFLDLPTPSPSPPGQPPRLTFDPYWLAISRALHPYLSTEVYERSLPTRDIQTALVADELERIRIEGLLVPGEITEITETPPLVWEHGPVDVARVQQFWPTAPPEGHGGSPSAWYTNPQTEAFCGMLGIENRVNPRPA